jgi:zinc D-Ala-D-Ala carboxypeptidase
VATDLQRGNQVNLSEHFSLEELTASEIALRRGLNNTPYPKQVENLRRLCETVLEPVRALLGVPLHINSGFRSAAVNYAVGGAANSAHLEGRAADWVPVGMELEEAFKRLLAQKELPYDQVIREFPPGGWIHTAVAVEGQPVRREVLVAQYLEHRVQYLPSSGESV